MDKWWTAGVKLCKFEIAMQNLAQVCNVYIITAGYVCPLISNEHAAVYMGTTDIMSLQLAYISNVVGIGIFIVKWKHASACLAICILVV